MQKLFSWGVVLALAGVFVPAPGAAQKTTKSTATPPAATASRRSAVSRDPYLGAIVVDAAGGQVRFEDHADARGYPASMLKLMDLLIILEKIERRELAFGDQVPVSAKAARTGGSQVWLAEKEV